MTSSISRSSQGAFNPGLHLGATTSKSTGGAQPDPLADGGDGSAEPATTGFGAAIDQYLAMGTSQPQTSQAATKPDHLTSPGLHLGWYLPTPGHLLHHPELFQPPAPAPVTEPAPAPTTDPVATTPTTDPVATDPTTTTDPVPAPTTDPVATLPTTDPVVATPTTDPVPAPTTDPVASDPTATTDPVAIPTLDQVVAADPTLTQAVLAEQLIKV